MTIFRFQAALPLLALTLCIAACGSDARATGKYSEIAGDWVVDMDTIDSSFRPNALPGGQRALFEAGETGKLSSLLRAFVLTIHPDGSYAMLGQWRFPMSRELTWVKGHFQRSGNDYRVYDEVGRYTLSRTLHPHPDGLVLRFHDQSSWLKALHLVRKSDSTTRDR